MKKHRYTKSAKRIQADLSRVDFDRRIQVLILRNQGWTFQSIGNKFGITHQGARGLYQKIKNMTLEELENQSKLILAISNKLVNT